MNEAGKQARREYNKAYYEKNREALLEAQRLDVKNNPDKYRKYKQTYWEKKAKEKMEEV